MLQIDRHGAPQPIIDYESAGGPLARLRSPKFAGAILAAALLTGCSFASDGQEVAHAPESHSTSEVNPEPSTDVLAKQSAGSPAEAADTPAREIAVSKPVYTAREKKCLSGIMTIAHMGMGKGTPIYKGKPYPEDSPKALKKGVVLGACGFETDYIETAQGLLVSFHDDTIDRMTDGTGPTVNWTPDSPVRGPGNTRIATQKEVLRQVQPTTCFQQQEVKQRNISDEAIEKWLANDDRYIKSPDCVIIMADNVKTLCRFNAANDQYPTGLINRSKTERTPLKDLPTRCTDLLGFDIRAINRKYVRKLHDQGFKVGVRNVESLALLRYARKVGVDRILTDNPAEIGRKN